MRNYPEPSITIDVNVTNPGQFFACGGLLELAERLWPGVEGWFNTENTCFNLCVSMDVPCTLSNLADRLIKAGIEGELSMEEQTDLDNLESQKRALAKEGKRLSKNTEQRRSSLDKRRREGALAFGEPFNLRVAWWQEQSDDVPKTFAGRQEVLQMALAMLAKLSKAIQENRPLDYRCLLQTVNEDASETTEEKRKSMRRAKSKVEPFYFDARRFTHALDLGFSLDVQEKMIRATATPMTELLALVGLQRFRPQMKAVGKRRFEYFTWNQPLNVEIASAVACGVVQMPWQQCYRFRLLSRDDKDRYKAFGFAIPIGE